jgi:hypothetical protein
MMTGKARLVPRIGKSVRGRYNYHSCSPAGLLSFTASLAESAAAEPLRQEILRKVASATGR